MVFVPDMLEPVERFDHDLLGYLAVDTLGC